MVKLVIILPRSQTGAALFLAFWGLYHTRFTQKGARHSQFLHSYLWLLTQPFCKHKNAIVGPLPFASYKQSGGKVLSGMCAGPVLAPPPQHTHAHIQSAKLNAVFINELKLDKVKVSIDNIYRKKSTQTLTYFLLYSLPPSPLHPPTYMHMLV